MNEVGLVSMCMGCFFTSYTQENQVRLCFKGSVMFKTSSSFAAYKGAQKTDPITQGKFCHIFSSSLIIQNTTSIKATNFSKLHNYSNLSYYLLLPKIRSFSVYSHLLLYSGLKNVFFLALLALNTMQSFRTSSFSLEVTSENR